MSGVNKVILIGNLGRDPEMRAMTNGNHVTNLSLATSESFKNKDGEFETKTEWHRVVMFNRLAEVANEYLSKGSKAYIEGKLQTREWEADGAKRNTTEIVASKLEMLDSKKQKEDFDQDIPF
tara:strand:+ start:1325 stop:1690 length:366 start_codon:yes stop_codon:yes gene_type:complete